jgi:acetoin utilization protein AcuB
MLARQIISDAIKPLRITETGEQALIFMHEYNVSLMPVVDNGNYMGLLAMEDIIRLKHLSSPLSEFQQAFNKASIKEDAHIFDVMKASIEFNVKIIPVLDEDGQYLGVISAENCLRAFASLNSIKDHGSVIDLEMPLKDFQFSEIARVVEENDASVLCCYTNIDQVHALAQVTIKVNTSDVAAIVAGFERYEYTVKGVFSETDYTEDMKDRYDSFMRYLNV